MSNLQLFAGEGGDGGGDDDGDGSGPEDKPVSFDDFLKEEGNQAEFDRRVQKAVNTAVTNAQEKWKALTDDKLTEAEKLAKMTKEEKAEYKNRKLEKELEDLKRQNAVTEMRSTERLQHLLHLQRRAAKKTSSKPVRCTPTILLEQVLPSTVYAEISQKKPASWQYRPP